MGDYKETGREMSAIQLIIACGNTDPVELLEGHKMFQRFLLNQGRKAA